MGFVLVSILLASVPLLGRNLFKHPTRACTPDSLSGNARCESHQVAVGHNVTRLSQLHIFNFSGDLLSLQSPDGLWYI